jgi:flagellar biosynthetic protein FliO
MEAIQQILAVAVVLLLLGATLWVLRRRGFAGVVGKKSAGRRIVCLERLPLGPHHTLHLVRVGETELLLAVSPSGCALLETSARPTAEAAR